MICGIGRLDRYNHSFCVSNRTFLPFSDTILRMLIYVEIFYCCLIIGFKTFVIVNFFPKGGYVVISYFKILNLPITGSSFARPLAALTMPRTASTRNTKEHRLMMLLIKYNLQEMARMIQLRML